jgi:SpoVK/Ycf46/Vps4 family AAA+-type ATPase
MASAAQLKALFRSHLEGDQERFTAVAQQIASEAQRRGQGNLAHELRAILEAPNTMAFPGLQMTPPQAERQIDSMQLGGLVSVGFPDVKLSDMVLDEGMRGRLERVVLEQKQKDKLMNHGLVPRRKLLLVGAPGTGKTFAASALAGQLRVPLYTVLLDGLITKFMGETAAKLRLIFNFMARSRGVFLFDEFDAIGSKRAADNDVGEMRRVLNTFLVLLEQVETSSLVVTATNHPELLDSALFRRFDDLLEFPMPTDPLIERIIRLRLPQLQVVASDWTELIGFCRGLNFAELVKACDDAAKEAVLLDQGQVLASQMMKALRERKSFINRDKR